jgi:hypothetical protein
MLGHQNGQTNGRQRITACSRGTPHCMKRQAQYGTKRYKCIQLNLSQPGPHSDCNGGCIASGNNLIVTNVIGSRDMSPKHELIPCDEKHVKPKTLQNCLSSACSAQQFLNPAVSDIPCMSACLLNRSHLLRGHICSILISEGMCNVAH